MFRGEYSHSIDAKGRLILPAKMREQLNETCILTRGLDACLYVYSLEEWQKIEVDFQSKPHADAASRRFARTFFGGAVDVDIDKQGRVLIPANLREYAKLDKDVVLTGVLSHIEIWDKAAWNDDVDTSDMESLAEQMADMGIAI